MAKRNRYPGRPGSTRLAAKLSGTRGTANAIRSTGLTSAEMDRAAELEAEIGARERAAIADNARRRARARGTDAAVAADASIPLSARAAHEYAYVARDVRRIGLTAGLMFGILGLIWVAVHIGGVGLP